MSFTIKRFLSFIILITISHTSHALVGQININTASQEKLELLPFIGQKRAQAIIQYRKKQGRFTTSNQLLSLDEIGQKTYEAIASYITISGLSTLEENQKTSAPIQKIATQDGDLVVLMDQDYYPMLMQYIQKATKSIDIGMYVFKISSSKNNRASKLLNALVKAKKRGISVNVLLEKTKKGSLNEHNQTTAKALRKHGVRVRFDGIKTTSHEKMVIIDARWNFIGSHNFTHSALSYNHEYSLLIDNSTLAKQNIRYLNQIQ